jgi:hypothetical protein
VGSDSGDACYASLRPSTGKNRARQRRAPTDRADTWFDKLTILTVRLHSQSLSQAEGSKVEGQVSPYKILLFDIRHPLSDSLFR